MDGGHIGRNRSIAIVAMVAGIAIAAIGMLTPTSTGHNMMGGGETYSLANLALVGLGLFIFAAGLVLFLVREEYQPLSQDPREVTPKVAPSTEGEQGSAGETSPSEVVDEGRGTETGHQEEYLLILRLLTGDERTMFRAIMDSGGEALQKDLIIRTKMSHAKVSRVIDRLEQKGVVSKERHGVTNKVRIKVEK